MQPHVKQLDNYVRGRTWVSNAALPLLKRYSDGHTGNRMSCILHQFLVDVSLTGCVEDIFTEEEKRLFREKPEVYAALRIECEDFLNSAHYTTIADSQMQASVRRTFEKRMKDALKSNPQIAETLIVS